MKFRNIFTQKVVILFILLVLCFSCSVSKKIEQDKEKLTGRWTLAKASFSDDLLKDFNGQIPYLQFENKEGISGKGFDGCCYDCIMFEMLKNNKNKITISVKVLPLQLSFDGNDDIYDIEEDMRKWVERCKKVKREEFTETFQKSTSYKLKNDTILILKSHNSKLEFHKVVH